MVHAAACMLEQVAECIPSELTMHHRRRLLLSEGWVKEAAACVAGGQIVYTGYGRPRKQD